MGVLEWRLQQDEESSHRPEMLRDGMVSWELVRSSARVSSQTKSVSSISHEMLVLTQKWARNGYLEA